MHVRAHARTCCEKLSRGDRLHENYPPPPAFRGVETLPPPLAALSTRPLDPPSSFLRPPSAPRRRSPIDFFFGFSAPSVDFSVSSAGLYSLPTSSTDAISAAS